MARTAQNVQVGKRKIELSNLNKILFPEDKIVKAELVAYYLKIAPTILSHVKGRPLSLVRFPDGIYGETFFQKNRPDWAPEWIEYVTLGSEEKREKDYILATEQASLVWLANLACIELHQMHSRNPHYDKPDYMVFDLDPPEGYKFTDLIEIAFDLKEHIERFGYHVFVKTTGRKGLHIVVPLEPKWDFNRVFETASAIAKPFVESHGNSTTLHIKKESRKGRILVDIYRNRRSQTIVSPYSVRGSAGAPVSMPLRWDQLESVKSPAEFDMQAVQDQVSREGDAWEAIAAFAGHLHTERKAEPVKKKRPRSSKYKTPEALESYSHKRTFKKSPEPRAEDSIGTGNGFVVHRHHASRLHYDLRLEKDGTLKSWAVPKGLPPRPGIKRLAVSVEDHPLEYLDFEGTIPKGEYGGGNMWVFARGRYEITKQKKDGFYFRLQSKELNAEYRIYHTRDNEWLLERLDLPQIDWLQDPIEPMLAQSLKKPPTGTDYLYEVKWDGIRVMIALDEGEVRIRSRSQRDISRQFPELLVPEQAFRATSALFDGEIVCLEGAGLPNFRNVINRLQQNSEGGIERARSRHPAVCYIFDCLYIDGRPVVNDPLIRRREWMKDSVKKESPFRVSDVVDEGLALFNAAADVGLEGIMAKDRNSYYLPGKRSSSWSKIKVRQTTDCVVIGYTKGKGDRELYFGALHIGHQNGDGYRYLGKVGTGFDQKLLKSVFGELKKLKEASRPIKEKPIDDSQSVWVEPSLLCEVQYASLTKDGTLREPVFLRLRPDLMG